MVEERRSPGKRGRLAVLAAALAVVPLGADGPPDPRIPLIERQLERDHPAALRLIELQLAEDPERAQGVGLDYLRGHLLLLLDRRAEALEAFATTMSSTPELSPYSRFRLAVEQEEIGHPEVAAGLVATLLRSGPPRSLVAPAVRLLRRTLAAGGDCRLLRGLEAHRFRGGDRRELLLAVAQCQARDGAVEIARELWLRLLEEKRDDPAARLAAERIVASGRKDLGARGHMLVGLAFYHHREFDTAVHHLAEARRRTDLEQTISRRELFELRYALARSHFWEERYSTAAAAFHSLADATRDVQRKAQTLYQEGRSYELWGKDERAVEVFRAAYQAEPTGDWADSAMIAALRLLWLDGQEQEALGQLQALFAHRQYATAARALLFVAASDLVEGRTDRAGAWLRRASQLRRVAPRELHYWQGRLEELRGHPDDAVEHYLRALVEDPYHPFGTAARRRLVAPELGVAARGKLGQLLETSRASDLYRAWLLLTPGTPQRQRVERALVKSFGESPPAARFLALELAPAADWPLWRAELDRPEEMLLALGLFDEGGTMVMRYFPVSEPHLAFTGSLVLSRAGDTKRSLYIAEILSKRVPRGLPAPLLPGSFQRLLFPMSYAYLILREGGRREVDPYLLAAIIREESRFDPRAFSAAAARGLTQFIFSTARTIADGYEIGPIEPRDLERPEVSIALGAAYLGKLYEEFDDSIPEVVAAYNAGEPQAGLWRRYCKSGESEEYLTKVAFRETRSYLEKVLTSRAHYAELYPSPPQDGPE